MLTHNQLSDDLCGCPLSVTWTCGRRLIVMGSSLWVVYSEDEQEEVVAVVAVVSSSSSCMAERNMHRRLCQCNTQDIHNGNGGHTDAMCWSHEFAVSRRWGTLSDVFGTVRACSVLLSICCISLGEQYGWRVVFQRKAKNLREIRSWSSQNCEASFVGPGLVNGGFIGSSDFTVQSEACTEACSGGMGAGGQALLAAGVVVSMALLHRTARRTCTGYSGLLVC
jgi:hypothetical protein